MNNIYNTLKQQLNGNVHKEFIIKDNTYFKIGGSVDVFVEPENESELQFVLQQIGHSKVPFYIIGNGTNLLFSDNGYRGVVIKVGSNFNGIYVKGNKVSVGAGTLLSQTAHAAAEKGLGGLEFASGIPGYMGGAIAMNAGAYGGEMCQVIESVRCMDYQGKVYELSNEEMHFKYRSSRVFDQGLIVLSADLRLENKDSASIYEQMKELAKKRTEKQPLDKPSAGSTFKRPQNGFAAKLIEEAGLKGLRYRGAMISDKHCGFVINDNNAQAEDVLSLMRIIRETVYDKYGVVLEPEVRIIGEDF